MYLYYVVTSFPKAQKHVEEIDLNSADPLDKKLSDLIYDETAYERASQALRRRFVRGADAVEGIDRGGRRMQIRREKEGGKYKYLILGSDGSWIEPEERIWVVAMYALWQDSK